MSKISIERTHTFGEEGARSRVAEMEPVLREKYGVELAWRGTNADVKGRGVGGSVRITADLLSIELKLGLFLRPFAVKIREAMESRLDKVLG